MSRKTRHILYHGIYSLNQRIKTVHNKQNMHKIYTYTRKMVKNILFWHTCPNKNNVNQNVYESFVLMCPGIKVKQPRRFFGENLCDKFSGGKFKI